MSKKKVIKEVTGKEIPIEWHIPENQISFFASNMLVQPIENEFKISFFEINPPLRLDDSDPVPEKVTANCVTSVIVSAAKIPRFIEALQTQLDKYNQSRKPLGQ